ncbi:hypothetical protein HMPREF9148_01022 [Prevotella sp. F0091]|nr:hypothetical protein HMPREF9148_01022 [Prevotella sp. F0091]
MNYKQVMGVKYKDIKTSILKNGIAYHLCLCLSFNSLCCAA